MSNPSVPHAEPQVNLNPDGHVLLPHHLEQLTQGSGIALDVIAERGYRSIPDAEHFAELKELGFSRPQWSNIPGLLLPLWTTDGTNGLTIYRPDTPRQDKDGKPIKYEIPKGAGVRLDCPPRCQVKLADPSIPLWITEGLKRPMRWPRMASARLPSSACGTSKGRMASAGRHSWRIGTTLAWQGGTSVLSSTVTFLRKLVFGWPWNASPSISSARAPMWWPCTCPRKAGRRSGSTITS